MEALLAHRLGKSWHVSPLEMKVRRLRACEPHLTAEAWLLDVANARGVTVVFRAESEHRTADAHLPSKEQLSNEELVGCILLLQRRDEPQLLRAAAQLISRGVVQTEPLLALAQRERIGPVLKSLAESSLRVDREHCIWNALFSRLQEAGELREPLLHWTRLAEPRMRHGRVNADRWELVK